MLTEHEAAHGQLPLHTWRWRLALVNHIRTYQRGMATTLRHDGRLPIERELDFGPGLVEALFDMQPDCLLVGLVRVTGQHLDEIRAIRLACPFASLLVTVPAAGIVAERELRAIGIDEILGYEAVDQALVPTVHCVLGRYRTQAEQDPMFGWIVSLGGRLRPVAALLSEGAGYDEIAHRLVISWSTARKHVDRVRRIVGAVDRFHLVQELARRRRDGPGVTRVSEPSSEIVPVSEGWQEWYE